MHKTKRSWDRLTQDQRKAGIESIITFFSQQRGETIGVIAAEDLLDFFLRDIGDPIYNKGVEDSKEALKNRLADLEIDLECLLQKS
ncbi:MAG TPA: DUF2164 domain-containing protein [Candidatus Gracilibacteria bacterium]